MIVNKRPDHYSGFANDLAAVMSNDFPEVCFYVYGSFARGEHDARRGSDIDGGFIFPSGVIMPQDSVLDLGSVIRRVHGAHRVRLQLNLLDATTGKDGRFLSYSDDFVKDIVENGKIVSGPDLRGGLKGLQYKHSSLNSAAFDLRKVRNFLIFAEDNYRINREMFGNKAHSVASAAVKFPKKLLLLRRNELHTNADEARRELSNMLDMDVRDFEQLERFATISEEDLQRNYKLGLAIYCGAASAVERAVQAYMAKFPECDEREARC
ncbi:MAG: hypothetical protein AABY16_04980 [Nanoarchaeota archaeon]